MKIPQCIKMSKSSTLPCLKVMVNIDMIHNTLPFYQHIRTTRVTQFGKNPSYFIIDTRSRHNSGLDSVDK